MVRDYREVQVGVYAPLFEYLQACSADAPSRLTFEQIEEIIGRPLPKRARTDGMGWWTNNPKALQARSWLAAGRHPRVMNGYIEFVSAKSISWRTGGDNLRITRRHVGLARERLNDTATLEQWAREIRDGWWEPHLVYVLHYAEVNLFKVGLTNAATQRIRTLASVGGEVIETFEVPNRLVATVLEGECLILADRFRVEPPLWIAQIAGATEFWRDSFELTPLEQIFQRACGAETGGAWSVSIAGPAERTDGKN